MCHFLATCSSVAHSLRLGTLLSERYSGFGKECLRSWPSRKTACSPPSDLSKSSPDQKFSLQKNISYGRGVFVITREDFVVWTRQVKSYGDTTSCTILSIGAGTCSEGAGTSSGSVTEGEPASCALNCLSFLNAHELPEVFACGCGFQDYLKEQVVNHEIHPTVVHR